MASQCSVVVSVVFVAVFLLQRASAKCLEHDYEIQEYLTSSKPPWDNYFRISKAVFPSVDLSSLMIKITVKFVNSTSNTTTESNYTWSKSCLYVSAGQINMFAMNVFSLGAIWPNRRQTELHIKLPPLCPGVEEENTLTYFLSTLEDIAEIPGSPNPRLNTVECVTKDHKKAEFSGFKQTLDRVCWFVLVIALTMSTVASQVLLVKLNEYCPTKKNGIKNHCDGKSKAGAILVLLTFVFVVGFVLMFLPFYHFDLDSDWYIFVFYGVFFLVFIRRVLWKCCKLKTCECNCECECSLFDGHDPNKNNFFSCYVVYPSMFIACHHLLWIVLGLITEPFWAFPVLMAVTSVCFVFYFLAYQYFKVYFEEKKSHSFQALCLSLVSFLTVALLIFMLLVVGQAFLSDSLIANIIQGALIAVITAWFKYARMEEAKSENQPRNQNNDESQELQQFVAHLDSVQ